MVVKQITQRRQTTNGIGHQRSIGRQYEQEIAIFEFGVAVIGGGGLDSHKKFNIWSNLGFFEEEEAEEEMKMVLGSPGTRSGLLLRTGQLAFAGVSIAVMLSAFGFANYTAFCYLVASMGLQALWSSGLACLDIYAIKVKKDLHNHLLVSLFVVGDWVTGTLSLAAACSSAGVTVLFVRDSGFCKSFPQLPCGKYQISTAMAFITWMFVSASALVMSWILISS